jgi:hypothetical protein
MKVNALLADNLAARDNDMNTKASAFTSWKNSNMQDFWSEVASADHLVQFYDHEKSFLDTLEGFVGSGLLAGENVIVIATRQHLDSLNSRLQGQGFDLIHLVATDQYVPLEATDTLNLFMVNDKPDKSLFDFHIKGLLRQATLNGKKVRAFGEMVAVLWDDGHFDATVQLEQLWHDLHQQGAFSLFCAYPKSSMPLSTTHLHAICHSHTMIIDGESGPATEIQYHHIPRPVAAEQ